MRSYNWLPNGVYYLECIISTIWSERGKGTNLSHSSSHRNYRSKVNLIHYLSLHFSSMRLLTLIVGTLDWIRAAIENILTWKERITCVLQSIYNIQLFLPCLTLSFSLLRWMDRWRTELSERHSLEQPWKNRMITIYSSCNYDWEV